MSTPNEAEVVQSLFVTVAETTLPDGSIEPAFQVGQYLSSKGADGKVVVTAAGQPWTEISYHTSRQACADAGYALITERQALAIALQVSQQDANWTGGKVGEGDLIQGLHLDHDDVDQPYPGDHVPGDDERRMFVLANGSIICDAAGNAYTWVFDNVQGNDKGVVAHRFAEDSLTVTSAPHPSMTRGVGWYPDAGANWSGYALVRGGCWYSYGDAGVFYVDYGSPGYVSSSVGFRCTKPVGL